MATVLRQYVEGISKLLGVAGAIISLFCGGGLFAEEAEIALPSLQSGQELIKPWTNNDVGQEGPPAGWVAQFHPKIPQHTAFDMVLLDSAPAVKLEAEAAYGSWVYQFDKPVEIGRLQWDWSVGVKPNGANLRLKEGDDAAAKLCLFVQIDESTLPLGTRLALGAARTLSGEELPAATLCYVWSGEGQQIGDIFPNPYTDRVVNWVLQNGESSRHWRTETREVSADVNRVFGANLSSGRVLITGLAIGADSDNTKSSAVSYFRWPQAFAPIKPPSN